MSPDVATGCLLPQNCDCNCVIIGCFVSYLVIFNVQVLKWSMRAIRAAVVICDAEAQRDILLNGLEHLSCIETFQLQHISSCFEEKVRMSQSNPNKRKAYEEEKGWSVALVASVVVSLRPTTEVSDKQVLMEMMMRAAQSEESPLISGTAAQAVASLLNKWVDVSTDKVCHLQEFPLSILVCKTLQCLCSS